MFYPTWPNHYDLTYLCTKGNLRRDIGMPIKIALHKLGKQVSSNCKYNYTLSDIKLRQHSIDESATVKKCLLFKTFILLKLPQKLNTKISHQIYILSWNKQSSTSVVFNRMSPGVHIWHNNCLSFIIQFTHHTTMFWILPFVNNIGKIIIKTL